VPGISELFWIFLMLSMLQPWLRQRLLEVARARLLTRIEQKRGTRLILLVHRQETLSLLGFPLMRFIDVNDAEEVIRAIHLTDRDRPIDILLHTPGGLVLASVQIARAVKAHRAKVTVFVPHMAMSGGTLIALAADEIVMDEHAVLGPIDPQIGELPAASILAAVAQKKVEDVEDQTLVLADVGRKALAQLREEVYEILEDKQPEEKARELAELFSQGRWTHDHPISRREAQQLGLNVTGEIPTEVYELMARYPQPVRRVPSVQYVPAPYGPPTPTPRRTGGKRP
jgi:ClpP class serine protease